MNHVRKCISLFTSVRCVRVRVLPIHLSPPAIHRSSKQLGETSIYICLSLSLSTPRVESPLKRHCRTGPAGPPPGQSPDTTHTRQAEKSCIFTPPPHSCHLATPSCTTKIVHMQRKSSEKDKFFMICAGLATFRLTQSFPFIHPTILTAERERERERIAQYRERNTKRHNKRI